MNRVLKKIHIYTGLLTFTLLMVWGIAGIAATMHAGLGPPEFGVASFQDFTVPPNLPDKEVARLVYQRLLPPLAGPVPDFALKRNRNGELELDFYSVNGMLRATVLEKEKRLRIENRRVSLWMFLNHAHGTTANYPHPDWRIRAWSIYNEFGIWSLLFMAVSGIYLWLSSRPRLRWAQLTFAASNLVFVGLYVITR